LCDQLFDKTLISSFISNYDIRIITEFHGFIAKFFSKTVTSLSQVKMVLKYSMAFLLLSLVFTRATCAQIRINPMKGIAPFRLGAGDRDGILQYICLVLLVN
jgi:hypothetical protein